MPTHFIDHLRLLLETDLALLLLKIGILVLVLVLVLVLLLLLLLLLLLDHIRYLLRTSAHRVAALNVVVKDTAGAVVVFYLFLAIQTQIHCCLFRRSKQALVVQTHLASLAIYHAVALLALVALTLGALLLGQVVKTHRRTGVGALAVLKNDLTVVAFHWLVEREGRSGKSVPALRTGDVFTPCFA